MGHREVTGVSPRYATTLQLSDTLLCLGLDAVRSKERDVRVLTAKNVKVKVHSSWAVTVEVEGRRPFKTRSPIEAQKYLMQVFL